MNATFRERITKAQKNLGEKALTMTITETGMLDLSETDYMLRGEARRFATWILAHTKPSRLAR